MRKKYIIMAGVITTAIIGSLLLIYYLLQPRFTAVHLGKASFHATNLMQDSASVALAAWDGCLYMQGEELAKTITGASKYGKALLRLTEDGSLDRVTSSDSRLGRLIGADDSDFYFWNRTSGAVSLFDINTKSQEVLCSAKGSLGQVFAMDDRTVYFPQGFGTSISYQAVRDSDSIETVSELPALASGVCLFRVQPSLQMGTTVERIRPDGTVSDIGLSYAKSRLLIPWEDDILIYSPGTGKMLSMIRSDGTVMTVFSVPAMETKSCFQLCGDYAYLSFLRYKGYDDYGIGLKRYENDELEGLYRIHLKTLTIEKCSNDIYDGLYNFDDTCLFACDENSNVFQLDLSGNIIQTVVKH